MIVEYPDFAQDADTLLAVGVGAVLATIGGFVGSRLEARLHQIDTAGQIHEPDVVVKSGAATSNTVKINVQ